MSDSSPKPPATAAVRASDAERARHVELLTEHGAQGRLSLEELSDRTDRAYAARTRDELEVLVSDLPPIAVPAERRAHAGDRRRELNRHLMAFALVNLFLIAIWAAAGAGYFWPIWPLLGWGIGVASHASETFTGRPLMGMRCGMHRGRARRLVA